MYIIYSEFGVVGLIFLLLGHDTTAHTLAFCLYNLAKYKVNMNIYVSSQHMQLMATNKTTTGRTEKGT